MKIHNGKLFIFGVLGIIFFWAIVLLSNKLRQFTPKASQSPTKIMEKAQTEDGLIPFAIDLAKGETDKYFGPPVAYDPNDKTMLSMRQMMLALAKAMDNPKHPCNPLNTTNTKIIGMNIKPLSHGDNTYTMWISDGKTICGMEAVHFEQ